MSPNSSTNNNATTNTNTTGTSTTNPWSTQIPYLTQAFQSAGNALGTTSQFTPDQLQLYTDMLGYGPNNMGAATSSANAGSTASAAGANGGAAGLYGLANFNPANWNNTDALTKGTNSFVSGLNIPGQVSAAMQPAEEAAAYGLNPQIDQNAAATGNSNSSRDAIEHGVLASNLANQANALTAQLTASGYNTGAGLTEQQLQSNNANALAALTGMTTGGATNLNAGTLANEGSVNNAGGLFNIASAGASGQNNDPFQALNNFYNIIGSHNWGGTTNTVGNTNGTSSSTTNYDPSTMSTIGAWMNMAGSLF